LKQGARGFDLATATGLEGLIGSTITGGESAMEALMRAAQGLRGSSANIWENLLSYDAQRYAQEANLKAASMSPFEQLSASAASYFGANLPPSTQPTATSGYMPQPSQYPVGSQTSTGPWGGSQPYSFGENPYGAGTAMSPWGTPVSNYSFTGYPSSGGIPSSGYNLWGGGNDYGGAMNPSGDFRFIGG
jgi:hypothetical protein